MGPGRPPATRYMLYWLSDVCTEARDNAGASRVDVASKARISEAKVYKFEEEADRWPRGREGIDQLVAAYAAVTGYRDHRELWLRAIHRWMRDFELDDGQLVEAMDGRVPTEALEAIERLVGVFAAQREAERTEEESPAEPTRRAADKRTRR
jgi:hypothetical protein